MKKKLKAEVVNQANEVAYRIHTLLHTMRAIERHEERLCGLMEEVKRTGKVTAEMDEELRGTLEEMPANEYADDIDAVRAALLLVEKA